MTQQVLRRWGNPLPFLSTSDGASSGGKAGSTSARQPDSRAGADLRPIENVLECQIGLVNDFVRLIAGKSHDALMQPDNDGGWGVVEILSHLLDWELVTHDRVHRLLNEDQPRLEEFDDSLWAVEHNYRANDPNRILAEIRRHRETLIGELEHLEPDSWQRTGLLERAGTISLHRLMNHMCNHDAKHLQQARDVLA